MPLPVRSTPHFLASKAVREPAQEPGLLRRRCLLVGAVAAMGGPTWANARLAPRADSPNVGVDPALVDSGLTARWSQAMRRDLGWAARWTPLPSGTLLRQLEQGDIDLGLYLSHPLAERLAGDGLIHDRHILARTDVLLVGPVRDEAGISGESDPARALRQVLAAQAAGAALWQAPPAESALAALVERLTQQKRTASTNTPTQALPYRVLTRAAWLAEQAALKRSGDRNAPTPRIWLQGSATATAGFTLDCSMAQPFRGRHPGARLLAQWLQGPLGKQALRASAPAWRMPAS